MVFISLRFPKTVIIVIIEHLYSAPSRYLLRSALRWPMMLNIAMNKYFPSVRKTKYSKLKESPEADPHTRGTN